MRIQNKKRIYNTHWFKSKQKGYKVRPKPDGTIIIFNQQNTFAILTDNFFIRQWFYKVHNLTIEKVLGRHMRMYAYYHELKGME